MIGKTSNHKTPRTVDEAAQSLVSDLLIQHLQALSQLAESEFEVLCQRVTPYLIDEFKLWQGNDALLDSCFARNTDEPDPAKIILNRVKEMLCDFHGFLVIT